MFSLPKFDSSYHQTVQSDSNSISSICFQQAHSCWGVLGDASSLVLFSCLLTSTLPASLWHCPHWICFPSANPGPLLGIVCCLHSCPMLAHTPNSIPGRMPAQHKAGRLAGYWQQCTGSQNTIRAVAGIGLALIALPLPSSHLLVDSRKVKVQG